jgi:hypothetical protein
MPSLELLRAKAEIPHPTFQAVKNVRQLAVLAYGSLLAHPGPFFGKHMLKLIRCETPFPVEYAGRSMKRRGGAPTLVKWLRGKPVYGGLIVLDLVDRAADLAKARTELAKREGADNGKSKYIRDDLEVFGYRVVYSNFLAKKNNLTGRCLAEYALSSVAECVRKEHPLCNGIRYLAENIEWGVETTLTNDYRNAILELTGCSGLHKAEAARLAEAIKAASPTDDSKSKKK